MPRPVRAYPRIRGGTLRKWSELHSSQGLSPHTRGNPWQEFEWKGRRGPIPAYAGEPSLRNEDVRLIRAYPRIRGGTNAPLGASPQVQGLSPHTRGNPKLPRAGDEDQGPIPAYAGEPRTGPPIARASGAYPRIRGGTPTRGWPVTGSEGLSPHTRGNLMLSTMNLSHAGPIPAYAGEPHPRHCPVLPSRAYPRIRGGTTRARSC